MNMIFRSMPVCFSGRNLGLVCRFSPNLRFSCIKSRLNGRLELKFPPRPVYFCSSIAANYCSDTSTDSKTDPKRPPPSSSSPSAKSSKESEETAKKRQIKSYDGDSAINRMLMDKYRVPEPKTTTEKVKEGAKDVYYFSIFAVALIGTGIVIYYVFSELFSSNSPNSIYGRALKLVTADNRVEQALGTPIKGFGEETRRGRRRHVSHMQYLKEGKKFMRMKFYVKGPQGSGVVNLEVKENEKGNFDYRYLYVDIETFPPKTIVLLDNR